MNYIVCVDKNWGIGKGGDLLFSLPSDMKFFRETTSEKPSSWEEKLCFPPRRAAAQKSAQHRADEKQGISAATEPRLSFRLSSF